MDSRDEIMKYLKGVAGHKIVPAAVRVAAIQAMASISLRDMLEGKLETIIECLNKTKKTEW